MNAKDRTYQFWERNPLGIKLYTHDVFMQKLEYNHWNPVKKGLCRLPEEYYNSSAKSYHTEIDEFNMLYIAKPIHSVVGQQDQQRRLKKPGYAGYRKNIIIHFGPCW